MQHFLLTESTKIKPNIWGIPEPVSGIAVSSELLEVVFVPLVAFDRSGHRVGYGKGCYDRFLAQCSEDTLKVGLSYFPALSENSFHTESTDIPLNYVITPDKIYSFT